MPSDPTKFRDYPVRREPIGTPVKVEPAKTRLEPRPGGGVDIFHDPAEYSFTFVNHYTTTCEFAYTSTISHDDARHELAAFLDQVAKESPTFAASRRRS
jgi:hypothetical protein